MNNDHIKLSIQFSVLVIIGLLGLVVGGFPFLLISCLALALFAFGKDVSHLEKTYSWIASLVFGVLGVGMLVIGLLMFL